MGPDYTPCVRAEHDQGDAAVLQILLLRNVLVGRDHHQVKTGCFRSTEQLAVGKFVPSLRLRRYDLVMVER
jgi:hypothetical protein